MSARAPYKLPHPLAAPPHTPTCCSWARNRAARTSLRCQRSPGAAAAATAPLGWRGCRRRRCPVGQECGAWPRRQHPACLQPHPWHCCSLRCRRRRRRQHPSPRGLSKASCCRCHDVAGLHQSCPGHRRSRCCQRVAGAGKHQERQGTVAAAPRRQWLRQRCSRYSRRSRGWGPGRRHQAFPLPPAPKEVQ